MLRLSSMLMTRLKAFFFMEGTLELPGTVGAVIGELLALLAVKHNRGILRGYCDGSCTPAGLLKAKAGRSATLNRRMSINTQLLERRFP